MGQDTRRPNGRWSTGHLAMSSSQGPEQAARLLRAYHRQVEEWFVEFAQARSRQRKRERAWAVAQDLRDPQRPPAPAQAVPVR
jgi:hypothetical protein